MLSICFVAFLTGMVFLFAIVPGMDACGGGDDDGSGDDVSGRGGGEERNG